MKRALALACLLMACSGFLHGCATAIIGGGGGKANDKSQCSERDARNGRCLTLTQESF